MRHRYPSHQQIQTPLPARYTLTLAVRRINNNPDGSIIEADALDICNGQADEDFGYRYHTSKDSPYIFQCLMGKTAPMRELPRVAPLTPADGSRSPKAGRPPRGGVENLIFTQNPEGLRAMTYHYQGRDYSIKYSSSESENCDHFETQTITNGGEIYQQELCR